MASTPAVEAAAAPPGAQPGDWLYRLLAALAGVLPAALVEVVAGIIGPRRVARLMKFLPDAHLKRHALALSSDAHADIAPHLDSESRRRVLAFLPFSSVLEAARRLHGRGDYATAAAFAANLSVVNLKQLIVQINDIELFAQVSRMLAPETVRQVLHTFSVEYLTRMAQELAQKGHADLLPVFGPMLTVNQASPLLAALPDAIAAQLARACDADFLRRLRDHAPAAARERLAALAKALGKA